MFMPTKSVFKSNVVNDTFTFVDSYVINVRQ